MTIDLSLYPPPDVVEPLDHEAILARARDDLAAQFPESEEEAAARGVPSRRNILRILDLDDNLVVKGLQAFAYEAARHRARINDTARATMVAYARGADLDNLALFYGVERHPGESDDDLRQRSLLAVDGFSTAGPAAAYRFHARLPGVTDVAVASPSPGEVVVTIAGAPPGYAASPELVAGVAAALSAEDVRPLTDSVTVRAATVTSYDVTARIWTEGRVDSGVVIAAAREAVEAEAASRALIGRGGSLSGLLAAIHRPGVSRAEMSSPDAGQLAAADGTLRAPGTITLTWAGTE